MIYKEQYEKLRVMVTAAEKSWAQVSYTEHQVKRTIKKTLGKDSTLCEGYINKLIPMLRTYQKDRSSIVTFLRKNPGLDFDLNSLPNTNRNIFKLVERKSYIE